MTDENILRALEVETEVQVRDATQRELDIRIMPWNQTVETIQGQETFVRGAFADTKADKVMLMGLEHEAHIGLGQDGRVKVARRPVGKGLTLEDREDGAHMTFRVARTAAGDEILALASDGIVTGASIEFAEVPDGTVVETRNGRRTKVHHRVHLAGLSPTYRPAYADAAILAVRSDEEGEPDVAEPTPDVVETAPALDITPLNTAVATMGETMNRGFEAFAERLLKIEENHRRDIVIPSHEIETPTVTRGEWMATVLRILSGERVPQEQMRTLDDLVTSDNIGVVPPTYSNEIIGVIDPRRPFMQSTRRLPTPTSGMSLIMPKIVTRPTVALQSAYDHTTNTSSPAEKTELSSTATSITTQTFDAVTKGGAGDISLQLLKRSSPSFLSLYLELLAEAYAIESEDEAVDALLAETAVVEGGTLDPENANFGDAWANAAAVTRRGPDTIWLSSSAVGAFINAKANGTNAPLYSDLRADFTAAGGVGGNISGLRPVWVPALDDETVDVIVGPSTGFAWAEDGTFTLQVDVPAKAGRDVAIVGILWFAPIYPSAFTTYTIAS